MNVYYTLHLVATGDSRLGGNNEAFVNISYFTLMAN